MDFHTCELCRDNKVVDPHATEFGQTLCADCCFQSKPTLHRPCCEMGETP